VSVFILVKAGIQLPGMEPRLRGGEEGSSFVSMGGPPARAHSRFTIHHSLFTSVYWSPRAYLEDALSIHFCFRRPDPVDTEQVAMCNRAVFDDCV